MAKTRARSSREAYSQQSEGTRGDDQKPSSASKVSIKSTKAICKSKIERAHQTIEPTLAVIDPSRSLRQAKAMAIVRTSELQRPRGKQRCTTPNTTQSGIVSTKRKQEDKIPTDKSRDGPSGKDNESYARPSSANTSAKETSPTRITRSSISSSSVNKDNINDIDMIARTSTKIQDDHKTTGLKNDTAKDKKSLSSSTSSSLNSRHSRVASLNAKAKVHLLYDDSHTCSRQQQSNASTPKVSLKKLPSHWSESVTGLTKNTNKPADLGQGKKSNVRELRSLPVRSANSSIEHQSESSPIPKKDRELPSSNMHKNKRTSHDDIEIIDTKKCKRQANLNASAFMLATCTSDYIISSNGPPAALLRQESALKNLKEKEIQQGVKTSNTSASRDPPNKDVPNSSIKSHKNPSTSSSLNSGSMVGPSKLIRVKTYSRKDINQLVETDGDLGKKKEGKFSNLSLGGKNCSIVDARSITLDERNSTRSDLIADPMARICDTINTSKHLPKVTQVRINTTEVSRSKDTTPSNSTIQVREAIHSKEKHRIKIRQTKATTSQSFCVELQTTVSQPPSTFITTGTSAVLSNQVSLTSSGGHTRGGQVCNRRADNHIIQSTLQHTHNALQIAPDVSASSSRTYTGRTPVFNVNSTDMQNLYSQESSTSMRTNLSSSLSKSLQHLNQSQIHDSDGTYVDSPMNSNSIQMIDVANSSSSQIHQNAFIIPSVTPLQSPSSSLLSPSSSSPFAYGFYHQQNPAGQSPRTSNQYNQQFIQSNKQNKSSGWTGTYQAHPQPSQDQMSRMKALPVASELFCDTNRTFDQFGNLYNQPYSTNDSSSMICTDQNSLRSTMNNQSQSQYQTTLDRQQNNSPYYSYDNSGNQRPMVPSHIPRNPNKNSNYQISRPSPPTSLNQSQAYQDSFMQTLTVPPLIGISGQPYLIVHPRSNEVSFSMSTEAQNKAQDSYCSTHNLMIPSVTISSPTRSVGNVYSLMGDSTVVRDGVNDYLAATPKKTSNKSQGVNVAKKSNKSQGATKNDRRTNKQLTRSSPKSNQELVNSAVKTSQSSSRTSEKAGLLAVAPFSDRFAETTTNTSSVTSGVIVSSHSTSSSSTSTGHHATHVNNSPSTTKIHGSPSVTGPLPQNQQAIIDTSNTSSPSESSDPSVRKTQKKIIKKRPLEGQWTLQGTPEEKFVNLTNESTVQKLLCYPSIKHIEGDVIKTKDSVLLRSGARRTDLPFIAKITNFWEDPNGAGIMMSLLWYYRPEHTEEGRKPHHLSDELFASRHRDVNSVACIEDKCYVLTFNEYCRYRKRSRMEQADVTISPMDYFVAPPKSNPRMDRIPKADVNPELVFCCRQIYDSKQKKIIKNPLINSKYGNQ